MKKIKIGYLDLNELKYISRVVVNDIFLSNLSKYAEIITVPLDDRKDIEKAFLELTKYDLDYLYVDSYNFLLHSFLIREKYQINIKFLLILHSIIPWRGSYFFITPFIKKGDVVCAPSEYAQKSFNRITETVDIHILQHCLDVGHIQKISAESQKKDSSHRTIAFMGRVEKEKGVEVLIECMPEIVRRCADARLKIIGPLSGDELLDEPVSEYVKYLRCRIADMGMEDYIFFDGIKLGDEKYRALSEAYMFVNLTTSASETFGIVNIEALACGLPVVATDWAANKEIIHEGYNGALVETLEGEDEKRAAKKGQTIEAICSLLENEEVYAGLKKNTRASAFDYDAGKVIPKLVDILNSNAGGDVKTDWGSVKDKRLIDFKHIFNEDIRFFLQVARAFNQYTYEQVYTETFDYKYIMEKYPEDFIRNYRHVPEKNPVIKKLCKEIVSILMLQK